MVWISHEGSNVPGRLMYSSPHPTHKTVSNSLNLQASTFRFCGVVGGCQLLINRVSPTLRTNFVLNSPLEDDVSTG